MIFFWEEINQQRIISLYIEMIMKKTYIFKHEQDEL